MKILEKSILIWLVIFTSCGNLDSKSTDEVLSEKLDSMNISEYYESKSPKKIQYYFGDTTLVHHISEKGIISHKLTYINDWLLEKRLSDDKGTEFLYEKFDENRKSEMVRYRVEFSATGDTIAYGLMKGEDTYFGIWTDFPKAKFKIVTEIDNNGKLPDSMAIYYNEKFLRYVGVNQIDDPKIFHIE